MVIKFISDDGDDDDDDDDENHIIIMINTSHEGEEQKGNKGKDSGQVMV